VDLQEAGQAQLDQMVRRPKKGTRYNRPRESLSVLVKCTVRSVIRVLDIILNMDFEHALRRKHYSIDQKLFPKQVNLSLPR
jgi:hypothetical protein